jgi:hypothetical protein
MGLESRKLYMKIGQQEGEKGHEVKKHEMRSKEPVR